MQEVPQPDGGNPSQYVYADVETGSFDELIGSDLELNVYVQSESGPNVNEQLRNSQLPEISNLPRATSLRPYSGDNDREWTPVSLSQGQLATGYWDEPFNFSENNKECLPLCEWGTNLCGLPDLLPTAQVPDGLANIQQRALPFFQPPSIPPAIIPRDAAIAQPHMRGNDPRIVEILVHHYRTHVARLMMPTSAPSQNPYLCIYLPLALQNPSGDAKECLLMALLSVAAFNKAELQTSDAKRYRDQAIHFAERASSILNSYTGDSGRCRARAADEAGRKALLAAIVTMTTVEVRLLPHHSPKHKSERHPLTRPMC
jgi:hypothetical protein